MCKCVGCEGAAGGSVGPPGGFWKGMSQYDTGGSKSQAKKWYRGQQGAMVGFKQGAAEPYGLWFGESALVPCGGWAGEGGTGAGSPVRGTR